MPDFLLILLMALLIADAVTTAVAIRRGAVERNQLLATLMLQLGVWRALVLTHGIALVICVAFLGSMHPAALLPVIALFARAVFVNLKNIHQLAATP